MSENKVKNYKIKILPNVYPLATVDIARMLTGKTLDDSGLFNVGLYIETCTTAKQFYDAVYRGYPVTSRLVTISGTGFVRRGNYEIKNGTQIASIMDYVGVKQPEHKAFYKMICGGAMSGIAEESPNVTVNLSISGLLFLTSNDMLKEEENPCDYCGKCADICPAKIMPYKIDECLRDGDYDFAKNHGIDACTACGACSYICPQRRHLTQRISDGKKRLKEKGDV